jgi:phosphatidylserine decarboxylase
MESHPRRARKEPGNGGRKTVTVDPVRYFDRATGEIREERIYGEAGLRWVCETLPGRLALEVLVKRALFSRLYGWWMSRPASRAKIEPFICQYGIDPAEFACPTDRFTSFNDFFSRKLNPAARPIDPAENAVIFPADGRHLGFPDISALEAIYAKGQRLSLSELLGDSVLAERYLSGSLVISRLCPVDYHRFHFPLAGVAGTPRLINGPLYSVNPIALRRRIRILWENKRVITPLRTETAGQVLLIEIGATNVGSIIQTSKPGATVAKGDEKGCFAFGGSMTMTLFEPGRVTLDPSLVEQTRRGMESYARMGERLATTAG